MIQLLDRVAAQGLSRDDLRRETRKDRGTGKRKPYTFRFRSPTRPTAWR